MGATDSVRFCLDIASLGRSTANSGQCVTRPEDVPRATAGDARGHRATIGPGGEALDVAAMGHDAQRRDTTQARARRRALGAVALAR